jgi:DNA polymerase-3 subunit alpha
MTLDDGTGRLEITLFEDTYQQHRSIVTNRALVVIEGMLRFDDFSDGWRIAARKIVDLDKAREQHARRIVLRWPQRCDLPASLSRLENVLAPWRPQGSCAISVEYTTSKVAGVIEFGPQWQVRPTRELIEQLEGLLGSDGVRTLPGSSAGAGSGVSLA